MSSLHQYKAYVKCAKVSEIVVKLLLTSSLLYTVWTTEFDLKGETPRYQPFISLIKGGHPPKR